MPGINQPVKIKGLFRLKDYNSLMVGSTAEEPMASSTSWWGSCGGIKLLTSWRPGSEKERRENQDPIILFMDMPPKTKISHYAHLLNSTSPGSVIRKARKERGNRSKGKLYCDDKVGLGTTPQPQGRYPGFQGKEMRVVHNLEDSSMRALVECWRKNLLTDSGLSMWCNDAGIYI